MAEEGLFATIYVTRVSVEYNSNFWHTCLYPDLSRDEARQEGIAKIYKLLVFFSK